MTEQIKVEVAFATPERQFLKEVVVDAGATVAESIACSGVIGEFPDLSLKTLPVGIWGKLVERTSTVRGGDRIEIYRLLHMDPREERRRIAEAGGVMGVAEKKNYRSGRNS